MKLFYKKTLITLTLITASALALAGCSAIPTTTPTSIAYAAPTHNGSGGVGVPAEKTPSSAPVVSAHGSGGVGVPAEKTPSSIPVVSAHGSGGSMKAPVKQQAPAPVVTPVKHPAPIKTFSMMKTFTATPTYGLAPQGVEPLNLPAGVTILTSTGGQQDSSWYKTLSNNTVVCGIYEHSWTLPIINPTNPGSACWNGWNWDGHSITKTITFQGTLSGNRWYQVFARGYAFCGLGSTPGEGTQNPSWATNSTYRGIWGQDPTACSAVWVTK